MPRASIVTTRKHFEEQIRSSLNLYFAVLEYCELSSDSMYDNPLHSEQAKRVVALAFLAAISSWEAFLEETFVRYMAGAPFYGDIPLKLRIGPCLTIKHSYELLHVKPINSIDSEILSWVPYNKVVNRASLFFGTESPYSYLKIKPHIERLNDAITIRNRIAHLSPKARTDFKKVVIKLLGAKSKLRKRVYGVGDLLLEPVSNQFSLSHIPEFKPTKIYISIFEAYMLMFLECADIIAPLPINKTVTKSANTVI